jgi:phage-related minor tail protein
LDKTAKATDAFQKDVKGAGDALDGLGKDGGDALGGLASGADDAAGGMGGLITSFSGVGAALAAVTAVVGAVVALGAAVGQATAEYNEGMRMMQAQTGKTGDELEALGDTAIDVYKDTFGASISDATDAVSQVTQVLGETDDALKASAKNALVFRDVFGVDIPESLRAVRSATESFGTTSTQTFDMLAKTIQNVGDPADDLADTVNEYSADFAQAGFSAEQMFGILEAGVKGGARNFDVMADSVREFTIRIMDGSDTTKDALENLFRATGAAGAEFFELKDNAVALESAIKDNAKALKDSEGAYKAQQAVVKGLQGELADAKRELDALARPDLKGFDEFDDKLFSLEQQSKRTQLSLLDLEPDTDAFEAAESELDRINNQIDKLQLQRDLVFDEQFRELEKAAEAGTKEVVSFEDALSQIARKKGEIAGIESSLTLAQIDEAAAGAQVDALKDHGLALKKEGEDIAQKMAGLDDPVEALLSSIASGETTAADAFFELSNLLDGVGDKLLQEEIGVGLFGTKFEELGGIITKAATEGQAGLQDFAGTMDGVAQAVEGSGIGSAFERIKKEILILLMPIGQEINDLLSGAFQAALPGIQAFAEQAGPLISTFVDRLGPAFEFAGDALIQMAEGLGLVGEGSVGVSASLAAFEGILNAVLFVVEGTAGAIRIAAEVIDFFADGIRMATDLTDQFGQIASLVWESIKLGIEGVTNVISGVISGIGSVADTLGGLGDVIPDWLKPGSPPPLANALDDIKSSLGGLDFSSAFEMSSSAQGAGAGLQSPVVGGGGGGSSNVTVNIDGVSATSVTNGDPNTEAIKMTINLLTQALEAA